MSELRLQDHRGLILEIAHLDFDKEILRRLKKDTNDLDRVFATLLTALDQDKMREFRNLNIEAKVEHLIRQAKMAKHHPDHRKKSWQRIIVDGILNAKGIPDSHLRYIFGHKDNEADLYQMTARYFKEEKFIAYNGDKGNIRIGMSDANRGSRPEIIAVRHFRKSILKPRHTLGFISLGTKITQRPRVKVIAVDVKTDGQQWQRFHSQATDYQTGSDEVYLATTSLLLLREGEERVLEKIRRIGVGLMHVDATTEKCKIILPAKRGDNFKGSEKNRVVAECDNSVGIRY